MTSNGNSTNDISTSTEETGFDDDENSNSTINTTVTESEFNENYTTTTSVTTTGNSTTTISLMTIDVKEPPGLMNFLYSVLLILLRHKFGIKLDYFINLK